jgi:biotin transport system substrate-specific component
MTNEAMPGTGSGVPGASKRGLPLVQVVQSAVVVALMAACAQVTVYIGPVPFTLQTFAVVLCALAFGPRQAAFTVVGYLLLGALGLPVFSGGRGGVGVIMGVTGGYLYGWLVAVTAGSLLRRLVCPPAANKVVSVRSVTADVLCVLVVTAVIYVLGSAHFLLVGDLSGTQDALGYVLGSCVVPFVVPDLLKAVAAVLVAVALRRALPQSVDC